MKKLHLTLSMLLFTLGAFAQQVARVSPYIFPLFIEGTVLQKGGGTVNAQLNYNTLTQEMLFMQGADKIALDVGENVDTIYINNRKFIPVGTFCYEKLTDTKIALYLQHYNKAALRGLNPDLQDQSNNNMSAGQGFRSKGVAKPNYELLLPEDYTLQPQSEFWIKSGKNFYSAKTIKKIAKAYPGKEQTIETYVKDNNLDITKTADLIKLVVFLDK